MSRINRIKAVVSLTIILLTVIGASDRATWSAFLLPGSGLGLAQGDVTPPTIVSVTPVNGATEVSTEQILRIVFSEPVQANEFNLRYGGLNVVAGRFSGNGTNTLTFTPEIPSPLPCNMEFTAYINSISDLAGNPFNGVDNTGNGQANDFSWSFETGCGSMPNIAFVPTTYTISENGTQVTLTVRLQTASSQEVRVGYATVADSAIAGADFWSASGTLIFPPGQTSQAIRIGIVDNLTVESDEQFRVVLSNAVNGQITNGTATVTIQDDDQLVTVGLARSSYAVSEDSGLVSLNVNLSAASPLQVSVAYATAPNSATAGQDYEPQNGTLIFVPGQTSKAININILSDFVVEGNETFRVVLSNPQNSTLGLDTATVTIQDNDSALAVTLSPPSATISTGQSVTFQGAASGGAPPYQYTWNFGSGPVVSPNTTVSHPFMAPGTYNVTFTATDQGGQSRTATSVVQVNENNMPVAAFTPSATSIAVGDSVEFINQSTGTSPLQYLWDFGDGNTSIETSPTHTYNAEGTFQVVLTVQNSAGSDTASATIEVSTNGPINQPLDNFTVSRSVVSWHEGDPEPAEYWIFGMFDFPPGVTLDNLTGDLALRLEIAGVSDGDGVSLSAVEDGFGYHERYSTDFAGQEIRDTFLYPIAGNKVAFVVAGQFRLPDVTRQIQPPDIRYRLRLPASIGGEIVNLNGVAEIQHLVRTNVWVFGQ